MLETQATPAYSCPGCGMRFLYGRNEVICEGDVSVCSGCGTASIFERKPELQLRVMTVMDVAELPPMAQWELSRASARIMQARKGPN